MVMYLINSSINLLVPTSSPNDIAEVIPPRAISHICALFLFYCPISARHLAYFLYSYSWPPPSLLAHTTV